MVVPTYDSPHDDEAVEAIGDELHPGLLLVLVGYAWNTDAFQQGLAFLFRPAFCAIDANGVLIAMGHAFFTLSLGMGAIMVYGSYMRRSTSIAGASILIALLDTLVALLAAKTGHGGAHGGHGEVGAREALQRSAEDQFDVLPANSDLTAAEVGLMDVSLREKRLALAVEPVRSEYDYILIDCPPSLNMLTVNALVASDGVLVPLQTEYYALEGLSSLMGTIQQIRQARNPRLSLEGILRTMHDPRNNLANEVSNQLLQHFGDKVYRTVIPRNVRVAEAPSHGLPVMLYDKSSRGAISYMALASEMARRHKPAAATPA